MEITMITLLYIGLAIFLCLEAYLLITKKLPFGGDYDTSKWDFQEFFSTNLIFMFISVGISLIIGAVIFIFSKIIEDLPLISVVLKEVGKPLSIIVVSIILLFLVKYLLFRILKRK